jgi:hypothetical protein
VIHYHGAPFSGGIQTRTTLQGRHACVTFADRKDTALAAEICQSFMLDNGAFSAWKSGVPLDLEGLAQWVLHWSRHPGFDFYLIPDVIDGTVDDNIRLSATWFNLVGADLFRKGAPVWHLHEPLPLLREYISTRPRVALGSSGDYAQIGTAQWWHRMAEAMEVATDADGFPRTKLHGLRMLDPTIFSVFPFSSADSTNVARNIGIDSAWAGTYQPASKGMRAMVLMDRIERHASAFRWSGQAGGVMVQKNMDLLG